MSIVKPDLVYQLACLFAIFGNFGHGQCVGFQWTQAGHDRVKGYVGPNRVFEITTRINALSWLRHQELDQLDRIGLIGRIFSHGCAGNVHMRTAAAFYGCKSWANHFDSVTPFAPVAAACSVPHLTDVIGVGNSKVANAAEDVARHIAVTATRLAGQVGLDGT